MFNIFVYHDGDWVLVATTRSRAFLEAFLSSSDDLAYTAW